MSGDVKESAANVQGSNFLNFKALAPEPYRFDALAAITGS